MTIRRSQSRADKGSCCSPGAHGHATTMAASATELHADHGGRRDGCHHADRLGLLLQNGALLDVQLDERVNLVLRLVQRLVSVLLQ